MWGLPFGWSYNDLKKKSKLLQLIAERSNYWWTVTFVNFSLFPHIFWQGVDLSIDKNNSQMKHKS